VISEALQQIKERHGSKLVQVLESMVEFLVFKRASYASLIKVAQSARSKSSQSVASSGKKNSSLLETESKASSKPN
jgi:hypothetical protein